MRVTCYIIATIGNSIVPWMIFFQGNASIDKGITKKTIRLARIDTIIGCLLSVFIVAFIITTGVALLGYVGNVSNLGPDSLISDFKRLDFNWTRHT